jgi:hypothetical protein
MAGRYFSSQGAPALTGLMNNTILKIKDLAAQTPLLCECQLKGRQHFQTRRNVLG